MRKKLLSFILVFCLVITLIPATVGTVSADTDVVYTWPTDNRTVSGHWGLEEGHYYPYHYGIDIPAAKGASVYAAAPGTVIHAGLYGAYGYCVQIKHANGQVTLYGHNSSVNAVEGATVKRGEVIAYVGGTGSNGVVQYDNHCHFGIYKSVSALNNEDGRNASEITLNPETLLRDKYSEEWPVLNVENIASTGKVKLSWYKKSGAAEYWVYRSTSKNGTYKKMKETTSTSYTNTSAVASKMYYYKVKAVTKTGKFLAWSDVVKRTCDLARPTITSASKVSSTGNIKVVWKDVKNANRYEVYRSTDNSNYTKIATYDTKMNTGKKHSCINSKNVTAGTKYYYKIKAINTNNSGADSALSLAVSCVAGSTTTTTTTTATANAMVSAAEACVGKSKSALGFTGEWCARFVAYCASKSGNASKIGDNVYVGTLAEQTVNDKGGTIIFVNQNAYNACKDRFNSSRCQYDPNYIPKKGDLYIQKGEDLGDQYFAHIGIVRKDSTQSHIAYTIEGNTSCSDGNHANYEYVEYQTRNKNTLTSPYGFSAFVKPAYATSGWPTLTADNVESTGKIKLSWSKKSGAAKYYVYRSTSKSGTYKLIKKTTSTTYTDTAATASKMYYYKVKAVTKAGKFLAWSDVVNRTCDLARPSITYIGNETATGNIVVKWKDVKNANRYEVYRATSDGNYTKIATYDTKMNSGKTYSCINSKNVIPGTKYYYKIRAINTNNTGADSALSTAWSRTADLAQPKVTLSSNPKTGKVIVSWQDVDGADSYKIYIATSKNGTYKYNATWKSPENNGEIHVVPHNSGVAGKTYYYKIRACMSSNENATSAYSKYVYRTCDLAQPDVTLSYSSSGKIVVSWPKVTGADRYEIYRSTSPDTEFERIYSGTSVSVTNTKNLTSGTTYYYKVRAIDKDKSAANSAYSEVDYLTYY